MPRIDGAFDAVRAIVEDLRDRAGLGGEWDGIDEQTRAEIEAAWAALIQAAYRRPEEGIAYGTDLCPSDK